MSDVILLSELGHLPKRGKAKRGHFPGFKSPGIVLISVPTVFGAWKLLPILDFSPALNSALCEWQERGSEVAAAQRLSRKEPVSVHTFFRSLEEYF